MHFQCLFLRKKRIDYQDKIFRKKFLKIHNLLIPNPVFQSIGTGFN